MGVVIANGGAMNGVAVVAVGADLAVGDSFGRCGQ